MFFFRWALKNLAASRRRTIGTITFITVVMTIMMVDLLFVEGANSQMKAALRNNKGDLYISSWDNAPGIYNYLQGYGRLFKDNLRFFTRGAQLIGVSGYAEGWVFGTEPSFLKYLDRNVGWIEKYQENLKEGTAIIESGLADKMNLVRGDYMTIKIRTESGMVNTLQVMVDGIFIGSNLIYKDALYINIQDQNTLWLTGNRDTCTEIRVYFDNKVSDSGIQAIEAGLKQSFPGAYVYSPKLNPDGEQVFTIFTYYRYVALVLFALLNIVFVIILYFAVQNLFFMSFRERRQELSTLLTYGMKPSRIKRIVLWESLMIYVASVIIAIPMAAIITLFLHQFQITNPGYGELIAAIGGPRLSFTVNWIILLSTLILILLVTLFSAYKGANSYLKKEIREIINAL